MPAPLRLAAPLLPTLLLFTLLPLPPVLAQATCSELVWADEFDGDALDTSSWSYQLGDGTEFGIPGWGNNEAQFYQRDNAEVRDGELVITARREEAGGYDYTSARLLTKEKVDFTYGRVVGRLRVPAGGGTWPALWMLSTDEPYGTWPKSGEIDVMEYIGNDPTELLGTVHYGEDWPNNSFTSRRLESLTGPLHEAFHEYAVDWTPDSIHWMFDGYRYGSVSRAEIEAEGLRWPFDDDFHLLANLAVGGNLGGAVTPSDYPAEYRLDYVRVYDGARAYLTGPREVATGAAGVEYRVGGVPAGAEVTWTVPAGASVTSGSGTPAITVDWGEEPGVGEVAAAIESPCGTESVRVDVLAEAPAVRAFAFTIDNFDSSTAAFVTYSDGAFDLIPDPAPDDTLAEGTVGRYTRNAGAQFDVIIYDVAGLDALDPAALAAGDAAFSLDLLSEAAPGTEILVQLESEAALPDNYPTGRHSRYRAEVPVGAGTDFKRLSFEPLDRPDAGVDPSSVTRLIVLFAPNTETGDAYTYDNFDVYGEASGGGDGSDDEGDGEEDDDYVYDPPSLDGREVAYVLQDFDSAAAVLTFAAGQLDTLTAGPDADPLWSGAYGEYARDPGAEFDVLIYDATPVDSLDPAALVREEQVISIDLRTTAPGGTQVILQLETPAASGAFPTGRHSRYLSIVPDDGFAGVRRLTFDFRDRPDSTTAAADVTQFVLLFAPGVLGGNTYTFDNLVVYGAAEDTTDVGTRDRPGDAQPLQLAYDGAAGVVAVTLGGAGDVHAEAATLRLFDLAGRLRLTDSLAAGDRSARVDVAGLAPGAYVVRVERGGRAWVGRFVR